MHASWGTRILFVLGTITLLCSHVGATPVTNLRSDSREDFGVIMELVLLEETSGVEEELICTTCPTPDPEPLPPGPDLVILDSAVPYPINAPTCLCPTFSYNVHLLVRNKGTKPSYPGYLRVQLQWGIKKDFYIKSIPAFTTQFYVLGLWDLPYRLYEAYMKVDFFNQTVESNENNNARIFYFEP